MDRPDEGIFLAKRTSREVRDATGGIIVVSWLIIQNIRFTADINELLIAIKNSDRCVTANGIVGVIDVKNHTDGTG